MSQLNSGVVQRFGLYGTPKSFFNRLKNATTAASCLFAVVLLNASVAQATVPEIREGFKRIPTQFIAALADPDANSGDDAGTWGIWVEDPGKTGVWLSLYPVLKAAGGYAPGNWLFDENDWWVDENSLLMHAPDFDLPAGEYLVTGEREVTTVLTVYPEADDGTQKWALADDASLFDVTHMPCRSARYTPLEGGQGCSPANADLSDWRVAPGSEMPAIPGCHKQDYAVLIVIGMKE